MHILYGNFRFVFIFVYRIAFCSVHSWPRRVVNIYLFCVGAARANDNNNNNNHNNNNNNYKSGSNKNTGEQGLLGTPICPSYGQLRTYLCICCYLSSSVRPCLRLCMLN